MGAYWLLVEAQFLCKVSEKSLADMDGEPG